MRTGSTATAWARSVTRYRSGMCQQFTRLAFGVGAKYGSASLAWKYAKYKHTSWPPPAGVPVYWTGGRHGYGHATVSLGDGYVRSTDWPRSGVVGTARITDITRAWGLRYAGWTEDINGVRVYTPKPTAPLTAPGVKAVRLANLKPGLRNADVLDFQKALRAHGMFPHNPNGATGYYGDETLKMCKEFQKSLGFPAKDADGTPGPDTLKRLGLTVAP